MSTAQRRTRLARRHHLAAESQAPDVAAAARSLIGLHATDPASVHLSARARVERIGVGDVDAALYEQRSIVKHLGMRRTLWAVPVDLLPLVQSAASDDVAAQQRRALVRDVERAGLARVGERWLAEAEAATLAALAEHGPLLGRELSRRVPALQRRWGRAHARMRRRSEW